MENLRRLRVYQFNPTLNLTANPTPPCSQASALLGQTLQPTNDFNSSNQKSTDEPKFNFHKLAESATKDKIGKRKTRPKKEYICRSVHIAFKAFMEEMNVILHQLLGFVTGILRSHIIWWFTSALIQMKDLINAMYAIRPSGGKIICVITSKFNSVMVMKNIFGDAVP